jgi:serine/threonine protein kinase
VWEAHRPHADLPVALKLVPVTDERAYQMWRDEITLLDRLRHDNIVAFRDADLVPDHPDYPDHAYIATELCERSLGDEIADGASLCAEDAVALVHDVLAALTAAHAAGCVHRDVKPSNILRVGGTWKLCDFGIAALAPQHPTQPTAALFGSEPYMSRAARQGRRGRTADLYAFGVTVHQALCGELLDPDGPAVSSLLSGRWQNVVLALIGADGHSRGANPAAQIAEWFTATRGHTRYGERHTPEAIAQPGQDPTGPTAPLGDGRSAGFWSTAPGALVIGSLVVLVLFAITQFVR